MTSSSHTSTELNRKGPPWPFILIVGVILLPIVAAYVAFYTGLGVSDERVNKGELLQPPVAVRALTAAATDEVPDMSERKWRLLVPVTVPCAESCQQNLYTTRQVHIRLGEKGTRVERVAVNLAGAQGDALLAEIRAAHPRLQHFSVPRAAWDAWLVGSSAPSSLEQNPYYLLVDQEGYAMMYYTAADHGNDLLDDIKRLLRFTPE